MPLFLVVVFWILVVVAIIMCLVFAGEYADSPLVAAILIMVAILLSAFTVTSIIEAQDRQNEKVMCEARNGYDSEYCK
jgi:FtsH-binding integral membrane protein